MQRNGRLLCNSQYRRGNVDNQRLDELVIDHGIVDHLQRMQKTGSFFSQLLYIYINGHVTTRQARDKHRVSGKSGEKRVDHLQARYGRLGVSIIELTQPLLCLEVFELELRGLLRAKSASASASASKQQVNRFMSKSVSPSGQMQRLRLCEESGSSVLRRLSSEGRLGSRVAYSSREILPLVEWPPTPRIATPPPPPA